MEWVRFTVSWVVVSVLVTFTLKVALLSGVTDWVSLPWIDREMEVTASASSATRTIAIPAMARTASIQNRAFA